MQWDEDLAEMAQAWADQCALVEYNSGGHQPKRLFHDARAKRSAQSCQAVLKVESYYVNCFLSIWLAMQETARYPRFREVRAD